MTLALVVALPFLLAALPLFAERQGRNAAFVVATLAPLLSFALVLRAAPAVLGGEVLHAVWPWLPALGLDLHFRMDGLALLFAGLVSGIGVLVAVYARFYLAAEDPFGRFYTFLLLFMGSMLGVVLAGNLLLLAVFWELTSISSFLLIGYWHGQAAARQGARMALAVTGLGGLAMLGGFVLLGQIVGSYDLDAVLLAGEAIAAHPAYVPMLLLVFLGAATKSAQFPFHFWLPHAMAAPTPVSAYLHSATMVKAGVFLLARLHPALSGHEFWVLLVGGTGLLTAFLAAYWAIFRDDLKGLLAFSTVGHLGLITALFGFGTPAAAAAGVFHILNHAIFKAALFMTAGIVDHEAGTRDLKQLGGLRRLMPRTALLAVIGTAAMAGLPPLNGFLSKELFFEAAVDGATGGGWLVLAPWLALGAGLFGIAYSIRFVWGTFFGPEGHPPKHAHEPPWPMRLPVELLVGLALLIGLLPFLAEPLVQVAGGAVAGESMAHLHLSLWHGFNLPLAMSAAALVLGLLLYRWRTTVLRLQRSLLPRVDAKPLFEALVAFAAGLGGGLLGLLDGRSLQRYALYLILATVAAVAVSGLAGDWWATMPAATPADGVSVVAWLVLLAACLATVRSYRRRLTAVVALSVVGLVVALAFARFSAPDLALTQLSVEVVTIVLLLLALHVLPERVPSESSRGRKLRDGLIAGGAGLGVAGLVWAVLTRPFESISEFHLLESVPGGGGTNVVNVILVDFRGFDTFGEITVLGIAALGVYALLDGLRPQTTDPSRPRALDRRPVVLTAITQPLLPVALVVALYLFLRGHNQPGGGFIAGLVAAVALLVQFLASGTQWASERLRISFTGMIAFGLAAAGLTGLGSWVVGYPFLTSAYTYLTWPLVGTFELASALFFDIGVFAAVVGATMLMLTRLGRLQRYEPTSGDAARERDPWKP